MKSRILVVEDNPVNLELVSALLDEHDCEVEAATSGEAALAAVAASRPQLILMDVQLPGMTGYEVTLQLKANPATATIPVVALTAHAMVREEQRAREAGCDGFLTKPIELQAFRAMLERFLPTREAR
jgi:two-component system cell cycle response regulator DivK